MSRCEMHGCRRDASCLVDYQPADYGGACEIQCCDSHAAEKHGEGHDVYGPGGERVIRFDDDLRPVELLS